MLRNFCKASCPLLRNASLSTAVLVVTSVLLGAALTTLTVPLAVAGSSGFICFNAFCALLRSSSLSIEDFAPIFVLIAGVPVSVVESLRFSFARANFPLFFSSSLSIAGPVVVFTNLGAMVREPFSTLGEFSNLVFGFTRFEASFGTNDSTGFGRGVNWLRATRGGGRGFGFICVEGPLGTDSTAFGSDSVSLGVTLEVDGGFTCVEASLGLDCTGFDSRSVSLDPTHKVGGGFTCVEGSLGTDCTGFGNGFLSLGVTLEGGGGGRCC